MKECWKVGVREEFLLNKQCSRINGGYVSYCVFPDEDNIKQHRRHGIVLEMNTNKVVHGSVILILKASVRRTAL